MKCKICVEKFHKLLVVSENVGKVFTVDGKDMTVDYFRVLNELRCIMRTFEAPGECGGHHE